MSQTATREPVEFTAGDTLAFTRTLPDYPATDGWSLEYELRNGTSKIQFTSTASGSDHAISVPAATTAAWVAGNYVLTGFATNGTERHQIYYGELAISLDAVNADPSQVQQTHAQKMIALLETVMLAVDNNLLESQFGETRFKYMTLKEIRDEHGYWVTVRNNEIALERAKAGLPTGRKVRPSFNVMSTGAIYGRGNPFSQ